MNIQIAMRYEISVNNRKSSEYSDIYVAIARINQLYFLKRESTIVQKMNCLYQLCGL